MAVEFTLPELGENVEKGDVVRVLVSAGDMVERDQPVLELETDKATIEVPSSVAGKITEVRVKAGDKVKVGQAVLVVDGDGSAPAPAPGPAAGPAATPAAKAPLVAPAESLRQATKTASVVDFNAARAPVGPARMDAPAPAPAAAVAAESVPAAPSVRRFARELGVDIAQVTGSGPGGRINQDDVKDHVKSLFAGAGGVVSHAVALPDFSRWGPIEVKPMSNIRRKTAEHLSAAWQAPHVTQHDQADVTDLETFREAHGPRLQKAGGKLTVTAILIRVVAAAIDRFPQFASSVDMAGESIVYKHYRHIGVAVDTPNGLLVPVVRDAERKTISEISIEVAALSQRARDRKLSLDEMSGGVFSITNLGGIGGTSFTPIVNQPEVAILGVSRTSVAPVWRDGQFVPRQMLPLSLSYDHRVIDGADAARFLRFVAEALEQPLTMLL
jgi:pyruvate dehydrogenase E2 component (dihydrolipoyllysine-residue acetyltransferase)